MAHISHSCRDVIVLAILFDFECFIGNGENPLKLHLDFMQILNEAHDSSPPRVHTAYSDLLPSEVFLTSYVQVKSQTSLL